jgi:hypothetical protein
MSDPVGSPAPSEAVVNAPAPASAVAAAVGLAPSGPRSPDAEAQSPGVAGGPPADGYVAGTGFWEASEIPANDVEGYEYIGEVFQNAGVRISSGEAAVDWLEGPIRSGSLPAIEGTHSYDVSAYRFTAEDQPILQHFLLTMAAAKATQQEVEVMLNVYVDGQKRIAKQTARAGAKAPAAPKAGAQHSLEMSHGGDEKMRAYHRELLEIRHVMATDRKRYNRDEQMQARYRELLAARI